MAVDWRSGNGFFDKVGKVVALINHLDTEQADSAGTIREKFEDIQGVLESVDKDVQDEVESIREGWDSSTNFMKGDLVSRLITPILVREIAEPENLLQRTAIGILKEVPRLMKDDSETIERQDWNHASVVGSGNSFGGSISFRPEEEHDFGDEIAAPPDDQLGIADVYRLICTSGESDGATEGAEPWSLSGSKSSPGPRSDLYEKAGSVGSLTTLTDISPDNLILNGGFEDQSSSFSPNDWVVEGGTGGFISSVNIDPFRGTKCLRVDDSFRIHQDIASRIQPLRAYRFICRIKKIGAVTGRISVDFDAAIKTTGTQVFSILVPSVIPDGDTWVQVSSWFNTREVLPITPRLTISASNLIVPSGGSICIDNVILARPLAFHNLRVILAGGNTSERPAKGDFFTITVTRTNTAVFQKFFTRFFGMALPHSATPTVADSLAQ